MLKFKRLLALTAVLLLVAVLGEFTFTSMDRSLSISTVSVAVAKEVSCGASATCGVCSVSCSGAVSCSARPGVGVVCDGEFSGACNCT